MVEKHTRRRSKSTSRRRRSRSTSKSKPIILPRDKRSIGEDVSDKTSVSESIYVEKRITRQSKILVESSSINYENEKEKTIEVKVENLLTLKNVKTEDFIENPKVKIKLSSPESFMRSIKTFIFCFIVLCLIPVVVLLNKMCENGAKIRYISLSEIKLQYFTNYKIIGFIISWLIYLGVLAHIPIGKVINFTTKNGDQVKYRFNGIFCIITSVISLSGLIYTKYLSTKIVYDNYYYLIGSSITVALFLSFLILIKSYFVEKLKISFHPGNLLYSFIMGREINPRLFGLDLKFFYEFRPGFISWMLLNIIFCLRDLEDHEYKSINYSLLFSALGQMVYCIDALMFEGDVISKSFMVNGQFGFFHCFGNQVIVPFLFTLTTRAIQINKFELPMKCLVGIVVINMVGYIIYRTSNIQKNSFQRNPYSVHLYHLKTLTNRRGHQLLVGGWWGLLRHPNYLGDIIISLSWSLYAGMNFGICWFYPVYFLFFIFIRCIQDDRKCAIEHEATWNEYRKAVPYRLIPFIF